MSSAKAPASRERGKAPRPSQAATSATGPVDRLIEAHPVGVASPAPPASPGPPAPSPEQLALEHHAAARRRLADHVATAHRNIASDIGAARQRLADLQAKAWLLSLERRRLSERIAEIDLDLREAEKAEKLESGAVEAFMRAQARIQPPPELV